MTWREWQAARQLLAEETVGINVREVKRREDAAFATATKNLQRMK
jgi:hypothetical protein